METIFNPTGHLANLRITDRENLNNARFGIDGEQRVEIAKCYDLVHTGLASAGKYIRKQAARWPNNPIFLNYIGTWHDMRGEREQAIALLEQTIERFPHYLFAITSMATVRLAQMRPDEALHYLGPNLRIEERFPDREEFHIDEVVAYEKACIKYHIAKQELRPAQERLKALRSIFDDDEWLDEMDQGITMGLFALRHAEDRAELVRMPQMEYATQPVSPNADRELELMHPQLQLLFERSLDLTPQEVQAILALPHASLVHDLQAIVQHSIDRFHHYKEHEAEYPYEQLSFLRHALLLLGELPGPESLEGILLALSQSREYLDLYLDDWITEGVWEPIAKLAEGHLPRLDAFMRTPRLHSFSKVVVSEGVNQLGQHRPEMMPQVEQWYAGLLAFYQAARPEDEVMDATQLGLLVGDILDLGLSSLLPAVEALYARDIVPTAMYGKIDRVRELFAKGNAERQKRTMLPIAERYAELAAIEERAVAHEMARLEEKYGFGDAPVAQQPVTRAAPKVGRNDPCPCGSGKKFKKCCEGKEAVMPEGLRGMR